MNKLISFLLCSLLFINTIAQGIKLEPGNATAVKISPERLKRIDQLLQVQIDSGLIKGAVGFVARDGKIIYYKALGIDDADKKTALKTDAIFRIASQTKAITSVAVMMLFEEGRFLLDDSIAKYIPAFTNQQVIDQFNIKDTTYTTKPAKRAVTIRDLLTHTSGIDYGTDTTEAIYAKAGIPYGCVTEPVILSSVINKLAKLPLRHQPGERFSYGLNTDVLGYLIEVLSKMSLDQFLQLRLFKPLGMTDTYFYLPPSKYPRLVNIYTSDEKHKLKKPTKNDWFYQNIDCPLVNGTYFSGGGGLNSTIMDYAIFLQMMLNGGLYNGQRILSKHTVDLMTSNQLGDILLPWDDPRFSNRFGLGFGITTKAGQLRLGQSEGSYWWAGIFNTFFWVDPKERLVCLLYTQQLPYSQNLSDKYKVAVYQALDD
jgi:CubicO group peptidase (beta-lactamase class C family)